MNAIGWAALAAGAAVLLPKPPKHNLMKLPSFRGVAEVRSSLPGRMRLYVPAVTQEPALTGQMVQQLESTRDSSCEGGAPNRQRPDLL